MIALIAINNKVKLLFIFRKKIVCKLINCANTNKLVIKEVRSSK